MLHVCYSVSDNSPWGMYVPKDHEFTLFLLYTMSCTCRCAQLILTVVVLQILQLSNSAALAGSGQCEREVAILDKSGDYTFHFKACRSNDPASVCHLNTQSIGCKQTHCDTILGVGSITRAQFTDGTCKGNIDYPKDDESTFNVGS